MKRAALLVIPLLALMLSGCSSSQTPSDGQKSLIPEGLVSKNEKGSVWKSDDGGESFHVSSTVDATRSIDKADILSISFHPTKPMSVILGTVNDGVFKTEDGGDTWMPIAFPPKRIYSFIIDRKDPDNRMFVSGVVNGHGKIFRTDDDGTAWHEVYSEPGENTFISSLAQDPFDAAVIYAGTSAGTLLKSGDAGATWGNVSVPDTGTGIVADIVFDPKRRGSVSFLSYTNKMYHSDDGGATWIDWDQVRRNDRSLENQQTPNQMLTLVADPSVSGTLYAGTGSSGMYRTTDNGRTWTKINIIESAEKFPIKSIAVDPKDPRRIVFVAGKAFYRSTDGGSTWSVTALNSDRSASVAAYDPFDSRFVFVGLRSSQ
ncbi:MAG: hypothetical protein HGA38_01750 [Candidatus Moranbacteria bacterium]|nr:hypothetical protein [Candidatus Moranbacteria bacterium]